MSDSVIDRVRRVIEATSVSQAAFAEKVGLTPDKLSKSLAGVRRFTSLDLALIAEAGGRTVDWLLTGREPLRPAFAARTTAGATPGRGRVSDAADRFTAAYEVLELLGRPPKLPPMPFVRPGIERFVDQGRQLAQDAVGVLTAADGHRTVAGLETDVLITACTQAFGVDVAVTCLPEAVDGLTWQTDTFRLILVGPTETWTRQRFTLAHELGHILARDAQELVVESHVAPGRQRDLTEVRANVFASNLLMPAPEIRDRFRRVADRHGGLTVEAFSELVVAFKVSPSALSARLSQLRLIDAKSEPAVHHRGLTTEICHLLAGATDAFQRQLAWAAAQRFPVRLVAALYKCYAEGETTLRPLASLLGMDVDQLHDLLDPAEPDSPEVAVSEVEEGDLIFQP
ncbi:ImmA/IrrE family metallo-endopeptidase [Streptomyces sp. BH-SS-21]|uniref:ImmA/IrrE family metallo-endopeptidase n=1 Tax=Streptomyces liliiviolaceus TaxID=2823109 RepID=A0A940XYB6_9ACTN|nr:XRE family transcriptional regulator [Streptomyces liliiviolaceus]MBQ0848880.1 ImmA/IrrE family metallo-endopeptidase [Streptomyces liliiviolaceus]